MGAPAGTVEVGSHLERPEAGSHPERPEGGSHPERPEGGSPEAAAGLEAAEGKTYRSGN